MFQILIFVCVVILERIVLNYILSKISVKILLTIPGFAFPVSLSLSVQLRIRWLSSYLLCNLQQISDCWLQSLRSLLLRLLRRSWISIHVLQQYLCRIDIFFEDFLEHFFSYTSVDLIFLIISISFARCSGLNDTSSISISDSFTRRMVSPINQLDTSFGSDPSAIVASKISARCFDPVMMSIS